MSTTRLNQRPAGDDTWVIATADTLDNDNAGDMLEAIASAQDRGFKYIVVDMGQLNFLSSAGVGSILGSVEESRQAGGDIVLCSVNGAIHHVLSVLDLSDYLTIVPSLEDALHVG